MFNATVFPSLCVQSLRWIRFIHPGLTFLTVPQGLILQVRGCNNSGLADSTDLFKFKLPTEVHDSPCPWGGISKHLFFVRFALLVG